MYVWTRTRIYMHMYMYSIYDIVASSQLRHVTIFVCWLFLLLFIRLFVCAHSLIRNMHLSCIKECVRVWWWRRRRWRWRWRLRVACNFIADVTHIQARRQNDREKEPIYWCVCVCACYGFVVLYCIEFHYVCLFHLLSSLLIRLFFSSFIPRCETHIITHV